MAVFQEPLSKVRAKPGLLVDQDSMIKPVTVGKAQFELIDHQWVREDVLKEAYLARVHVRDPEVAYLTSRFENRKGFSHLFSGLRLC